MSYALQTLWHERNRYASGVLAVTFSAVLIATNTTIQRPNLGNARHAGEAGGLSGAPLKPLALAALRALRSELGPDYPLVGVGGIFSGADAAERRAAGADLVQLYTGFIYRGPALVAECSKFLLRGAAAGR